MEGDVAESVLCLYRTKLDPAFAKPPTFWAKPDDPWV
jgi:hypothetical protein